MKNPIEKENDRIADKLLIYLRNELNDPKIEYSSPVTQILGGFDTAIYQFQLEGVEKELSRRLVLRLFPEYQNPNKAVSEYIVQNVIASEGYPVAKGHFLCTDKSVLGGAFFIMDFLSGQPMTSSPIESIPEILGKTHARIHTIDPGHLIELLEEQGFEKSAFGFDNQLLKLKKAAKEMPWIGGAIAWLEENRPPEPERLAICHGDFHPLNILVEDGKVSGVVDWPNICIADAAWDVASTIWVLTVPAKFVFSEFASADWEMFVQAYLEAYRTRLDLDSTHLDYYRVLRSTQALWDGFQGQELFQNPSIIEELIKIIHEITGILLSQPE